MPITDTIDPPVVLPDVDTIDWDYVLNNVGGSIPLPRGPVYLPVKDPPPPKNASKESRAAYLKRKVEEALKAAKAIAGASGGAAGAAARPPTASTPGASGAISERWNWPRPYLLPARSQLQITVIADGTETGGNITFICLQPPVVQG